MKTKLTGMRQRLKNLKNQREVLRCSVKGAPTEYGREISKHNLAICELQIKSLQQKIQEELNNTHA